MEFADIVRKNGWVEVDVYGDGYHVGTSYTVLMTLPAGYRPAATLYYPQINGNNINMLSYIDASGSVGIKAWQDVQSTSIIAHMVFPV